MLYLEPFKVSSHVGFVALLVNALSKEITYFYKRLGFITSPIDPLTLMLPIKNII